MNGRQLEKAGYISRRIDVEDCGISTRDDLGPGQFFTLPDFSERIDYDPAMITAENAGSWLGIRDGGPDPRLTAGTYEPITVK